jgi:hypothetical protein
MAESDAARQRKRRAKKKQAGLLHKEFWLPASIVQIIKDLIRRPEWVDKVKAYIDSLKNDQSGK